LSKNMIENTNYIDTTSRPADEVDSYVVVEELHKGSDIPTIWFEDSEKKLTIGSPEYIKIKADIRKALIAGNFEEAEALEKLLSE
jgi:hypothetical protein